MDELRVIESELVPVYETSTGEKVVYGSELHEVLGVKSRYREWIDRRLSDIDAVESEDFQAAEISAPSGQTKKDHIIKLDIAKEMAMLERNEKGKQVRRYFIQIEKKYKSIAETEFTNLSTELQAIIMHDKKLVKMEKRLDKLEYDVPLYGNEADEISAHVKRKGINIMGGKKSEAYKAKDIRAKVYRDIYSQLKREFGLYAEDDKPQSYKALKRKNIYDAHEFIDAYEAPLYLREIIENANAQIAFGDIA